MSGYQDGDQWVDGDGNTHTVNSTNDPAAPGGYYHSVVGSKLHETTVYNADGTLADVHANRFLEDRERQD